MQVLKILSDIWKTGAEIYRDETDGRLGMRNYQKISPETMKAAEQTFPQIDQWFKSWEQANNIDLTIQKGLHLICGWQINERMNDWLCKDVDSALLLYDWTTELAKNGWTDIYDDFRKYENQKSNELKKQFYERAVFYVSQNK